MDSYGQGFRQASITTVGAKSPSYGQPVRDYRDVQDSNWQIESKTHVDRAGEHTPPAKAIRKGEDRMRMSVLTKSMERLRKAADQGYIQHEDLNILVAEADKHDVTASAMFNDQELRTAKLESAFRRLAQEYHQTLQDERGNDTAVIQYHMSERFEDCPQCKSNADVLS